jgi:hypothetical protein
MRALLPSSILAGALMALVTRFAPLGYLNDLKTDAQLASWSQEVESLMSKAVAGVEKHTKRGNAQFADPSRVDMGAATAAPISWQGFPKSLTAKHSLEEAYKIADGLLADEDGHSGRDVQDEYLEWYVERDATGDLTRIDFTTEGPEYWDTLLKELGPEGIVSLYQKYYPSAQKADLFRGGRYNRKNIYNDTRGAMHLRQVNNNLWAEVAIAAFSTLTYTLNGKTLTDGGDLCHYASLGERSRASDPNIAQTVNSLAREGRRLSLEDPIGLYLEPPDFAQGWKTPDGSNPAALWTIERGNPATRATLQSNSKFKLSDVTIGGENIRYGGQVANLIKIHLTGLYSVPNIVMPTEVPVDAHLQVDGTKLFALTLGGAKKISSITGR